jgi:putative PIN family toxin of toxin-antitoxin system
MPAQRAIPIQEFREANWEAFAQFEGEFDRNFRSYSRTLPPRFYRSMRRGVTEAFGGSIERLSQAGLVPRFHVKVVLDTNIVVMDSLAVASGKPSTTSRILSSPFVQVFAPPEIREECDRIIRLRARKKRLSVDAAIDHAHTMLRGVRIVSPDDEPFIRRARDIIGSHSPEDVTFLAVAMESEADAIVSRDQAAFDNQAVAKRWDLHNLVDTVVTFESGALSVVVVGTGLKALLRGLQTVVIAIAGAVLEILRVVLRTLAELVSGVIGALESVPAWGWPAVGAALVGLAIYASRHPDVGQRIGQGIGAVAAAIANLSRALIQAGTAILQGLHELLVWLWNLLLPVTATSVVVAGVLLRRIQILLAQASRLQQSVPSG